MMEKGEGGGNGGEGKAMGARHPPLAPPRSVGAPSPALRGLEPAIDLHMGLHHGTSRRRSHFGGACGSAYPSAPRRLSHSVDACLPCCQLHDDGTAMLNAVIPSCVIVNCAMCIARYLCFFSTATCIKIKSKSENIRRLFMHGIMECPRSSEVGTCVSCVRE